MKKTFKDKTIKMIVESEKSGKGFILTVFELDNKKSYRLKCNNIEEVKSEAHEMANNNDQGRKFATWIHDWFYKD